MRFHPYASQAVRQAAYFSIVAMVGATVTTLSDVKGADLNPAHVPADAKWLFHVDQEALSDLEVSKELRELYPQITSRIRKWFRDRYGIDLQDGLQSLTMFSRDYQPHTGTVLLQTDYEDEKIRSLLHEYVDLKKTAWKEHTLYTITLAKHHGNSKRAMLHASQHGAESHGEGGDGASTDGHDLSGGKQMTVFLGDELIVLASSVPNAKSVLRLLEGDAKSLEEAKSPLIAEVPEGAVIYGAAIELGRLEQYQMLLPLLQQQERCAYAFGQRDGKLFETLTLTAQDEDVADKTIEVLEGLIAYEQLCAAGSEPLTELIENVQLSRDGMESTLSWEGESKLVVDALDDLKARTDEWMKRFAQPVLETLKRRSVPETADATTRRSREEQSHEGAFALQERHRERRLADRAWLGAMVRAATGAGVEIARIYVDGPADKAGLKAGDFIAQIDGEDVSSPQAVAQRIGRLKPGAKVDVAASRDGEELTVEVEVGNLDDFHERLFGKRFRHKFDDVHEMFDPDFDGVPEGVFSFRLPSGQDDELTLRELLREMRQEVRELRREFRKSNRDDRNSSNEQGRAESKEG